MTVLKVADTDAWWSVCLPACICLWSAHMWRCSWRCRDGWTQEEDLLLSSTYSPTHTPCHVSI